MFSRRRIIKSAALTVAAVQAAKWSALAQAANSTGLAAAFSDAFKIGVAVSDATLSENIAADWQLIDREFNAVTAENAMKWERIRPEGKTWFWDNADRLVEHASKNDTHITGHTLVWHSQVPRAVFHDADGKKLSRNDLLKVMEDHIGTMVGRYKGRIQAWDVVNEGIDEGNGWRKSSPWFDIIGDDYMELAFRMTHAVDPQAQLLYNDYNMHNPAKRTFLKKLFAEYLDRGVPIHGVGFQTHVGLAYPDLEEWEASLEAYAELGLKIHITELEVDVLPNPFQMSAEISNRFEYSPETDPYKGGLPEQVQEQLAERYAQLFKLFIKHQNSIDRVTFWGLYDAVSWKNNFPINGRTNYPLLFDRQRQPKPAYHKVLKMASDVG